MLEALALDYKGLDLQEDATLLWGAAESLRERYTSPLPPSYQESYNSAIMEVSARLGETDFKEESGLRDEPLRWNILWLGLIVCQCEPMVHVSFRCTGVHPLRLM